MKNNLGRNDRIFRVMGGGALLMCAFAAPLPPVIRLALFGAMGSYLLLSALVGSCAGYALIGKTTCETRTE